MGAGGGTALTDWLGRRRSWILPAQKALAAGFAMTISVSTVGGVLVACCGLMRSLLVGAILVASTNLLFAVMAQVCPDLILLAVVMSAGNLTVGISGVALIAYLSSLTNRAYTATQCAPFSSLMTLPGKAVAGFSGAIVDAGSHTVFFVYAASIGIQAILLVLYLLHRQGEPDAEGSSRLTWRLRPAFDLRCCRASLPV